MKYNAIFSMPANAVLGAMHRFLAKGSNRIAMSTAIRGTISTIIPLVVFPHLGFGPAASLAIIGALNAAMVDIGGSYSSRLLAMAAVTFGGPCIMLLGMAASSNAWVSALIMFTIAFLGGFVRSAGAGAIPVGMNMSVMFLIGIEVVPPHADERLALAAGVVSGGVWTILVALAFWQLRPYRRVEMELASLWQALADLVREAMPADAPLTTEDKQQEEQSFTRHHLAIRTQVEQARMNLGDLRAETQGIGTIMGKLLVMVRAVSRIEAAIVVLHETGAVRNLSDTQATRAWTEAVSQLEKACRGTATMLLSGNGGIDHAPARQSFAAIAALVERREGSRMSEERVPLPWILAMARAVRHLDSAEEVLRTLFSERQSVFHIRIPTLTAIRIADVLPSMRAQLTPRSLIFRHAVRVAVVGAGTTAAIIQLYLPHGIWLAMTSIIVLQPDYGGTLSRALHRGLGTLGGAVLASLLLITVHGSSAYELVIGVLLFATFLLLRRNYGVAMTFLTPLVILLLGLSGSEGWDDLRNRVLYTIVGVAFAVIAGYLLWPVWEQDRLPERFAKAIRSGKAYLVVLIDALITGQADADMLSALRSTAEIDAGNADAAFQRMLSEQKAHRRGNVAQALVLDTYVQRLTLHTLSLATHFGEPILAPEPAAALRQMLDEALDNLADSLDSGSNPRPRPNFDEPLEKVREKLLADREPNLASAVAFALGQIVSDATSLHSAVINQPAPSVPIAGAGRQPMQIA